MAIGLRKQYNYADSEHAELIRLVMVNQSESRHRNPNLVPRASDDDARRLLGTVEHNPAPRTSVYSVLRVG